MSTQPRLFGRIPAAVARSSLSRGKLYDLAAQNPGLFRKAGAATIVDLTMLDEVLATLPPADINCSPATELDRILAEILVAEDDAEIAAILRRHAKVIAALPPREREQANEKIQDAIAERREAWSNS